MNITYQKKTQKWLNKWMIKQVRESCTQILKISLVFKNKNNISSFLWRIVLCVPTSRPVARIGQILSLDYQKDLAGRQVYGTTISARIRCQEWWRNSWILLELFWVNKYSKILKKCAGKCSIFTIFVHESDRIWRRRTSNEVGDPGINFIRPKEGAPKFHYLFIFFVGKSYFS